MCTFENNTVKEWKGYGNESLAGSKLITATFLDSKATQGKYNTQN